MLALCTCRRGRRRRRWGRPRPCRGCRRRRRGHSRPASSSRAGGPVREPCRGRRGCPARGSSPVHGSAGRRESTTSCWAAQSAPLVNQNEITKGRPKRSQTRIAPAVRIDRRGSGGRLRARHGGAFAVVLGDVGVAFELARRGGNGELRQRPARRLAVEAQRLLAAAPFRVGSWRRDHREEDQPDDDRVAVFHRSSIQASAAGSTTITPSRAAARSITVTKPKSRSIWMLLAIRTAKPATAVAPEASTAAPVRS